MERGENIITYDAPLAIYFYGSPYSDPADAAVAATYAMITSESLGLGTCMVGSVHPLIQFGAAGRRFRKGNGILNKSNGGLIVLFGHASVEFRKNIERTFASEDYYQPAQNKN